MYPVVVRESPLDWVKFDARLARDGSVDPVDKALYAALVSFVDQEARTAAHSTDPDDENIPTRKRLAKCIGRSVDTVDRATKRLEERGLLEVVRMKDPKNPRSNIPSSYRLLDVELWDERAAGRAEQRRAERAAKKKAAAEAKAAAERAAQEAENQDEPDDEGWPHPCGQGGRTHAARVAAPMRPGWPHRCGGTSSPQRGSSSSSTKERPEDEEEDTPSAPQPPSASRSAQMVIDAVQATEDEAQLVLERIKAEYKSHHGRSVPSVGRYVAGFDPEDLRSHLEAVRAQRASEDRAAASEAAGADKVCAKHHAPLDCPVCATVPLEVAQGLLEQFGPVRRPDLARRLGVLAGASA